MYIYFQITRRNIYNNISITSNTSSTFKLNFDVSWAKKKHSLVSVINHRRVFYKKMVWLFTVVLKLF